MKFLVFICFGVLARQFLSDDKGGRLLRHLWYAVLERSKDVFAAHNLAGDFFNRREIPRRVGFFHGVGDIIGQPFKHGLLSCFQFQNAAAAKLLRLAAVHCVFVGSAVRKGNFKGEFFVRFGIVAHNLFAHRQAA